jgi:hypothetical protein
METVVRLADAAATCHATEWPGAGLVPRLDVLGRWYATPVIASSVLGLGLVRPVLKQA